MPIWLSAVSYLPITFTMDARIVITRVIAGYMIVMALATAAHAVLSPIIYSHEMNDVTARVAKASDDGTPLLWDFMNPLNILMLILVVVMSGIRKFNFDRDHAGSADGPPTTTYFEVNATFYFALAALLLLIINWTNALHDTDKGALLLLWYYLDAAILILGLATGLRILRGTGIDIGYPNDGGSSSGASTDVAESD